MLSVHRYFPVKFLNEVHPSIYSPVKKLHYTDTYTINLLLVCLCVSHVVYICSSMHVELPHSRSLHSIECFTSVISGAKVTNMKRVHHCLSIVVCANKYVSLQ